MSIERGSIDNQYKWDIERMYPTENSIEEDILKIKNMIKEIEHYKGTMCASKENLYAILSLSDESSRVLHNLYIYTNMKHHEDTRINKNQAWVSKLDTLCTELSSATSYIEPSLMLLNKDVLNKWLEDDNLKIYKKNIDELLKNRDRILSEKEEELLASIGDITGVPDAIYEILSYADMSFPDIKNENGETVKLTDENYSLFIRSKNRELRKNAFENLFKTYASFKNTFATTLYNSIKTNVFYAKIRKFDSVLEQSLFHNDINLSVYTNLIDAITENIPSLNKYTNLKKELLNIEDLHMYDLYTPLVKDLDIKIPYEKAQEIILEALKPLGEEYLTVIKKAFSEKWIDVYPNDGKRGGAYSWGSYDSPSYILMNYNDDVNSLFTLAHELGHSAHSHYSKNNQPFIYSGYTTFVAEVASTLNESLLMDYMLKNSKSKEERLYLLNYYLEQFRTTVFRQVMFAEFEKITHQKVENGVPLTADEFYNIYYDLNKKYYGDVVSVDEEIGYEWARIPHFYNSFYVYKYATGFSAASALSKQILTEGSSAVDRYLEFLKSGGSDYPLNQLRAAGVDMEKKESIQTALDVFKELVSELEKESQ